MSDSDQNKLAALEDELSRLDPTLLQALIGRLQQKIPQPAIRLASSNPDVERPSYDDDEPFPSLSESYTSEVFVGGQKVVIHTGQYENEMVGRVWIDLGNKASQKDNTIMHVVADLMTLGLQAGVPLEDILEPLRSTRFKPSGEVENHPHITSATSLFDLVAQDLAARHLADREDLMHLLPAEPADLEPSDQPPPMRPAGTNGWPPTVIAGKDKDGPKDGPKDLQGGP